MILPVREEVKIILLFIGLSHFAVTLEDSAFVHHQAGSEKVSVELARGVDLHSPRRADIALDSAVDDDRMDIDLSLDECGFSYDQCSALEDLSLKLSLQAKDTLKGHLPFKDRLLPQKSADLFCGRGRFWHCFWQTETLPDIDDSSPMVDTSP